MLAEHFHDPSLQGQFAAVGIFREIFPEPNFLSDRIKGFEFVGLGLVRAEDAEVLHIQPHDLPKEMAKSGYIASQGSSGFFDLHGERAEVRHIQGAAQQTPIGHGVGTHAPPPLGRQSLQFRDQSPLRIKVFFRLVAAHPGFQQGQMGRVGGHVREGDLMGSPETFQIVSVHLPGGCPAFGTSKNDHRPAGAVSRTGLPGLFLELANLQDTVFQSGGHRLMHALRIAALHEVGGISITDEERLQFRMTNARQNGGVVDFIAVEMEYRQDRPIGNRIEEFVAMPTCGQWSGLRLAIADHHQGDQVRVVKDRSEGMRNTVTKFAALMNAAGCFRSRVATDAPGEGKLLEEALHAYQIFTYVGINLGVGSFEICLR